MLKAKIVSKMTRVMARESLTRIGMRTFTSLAGESHQPLEIPALTDNSGPFVVGQRTPWISDGQDGVSSILRIFTYLFELLAGGQKYFENPFILNTSVLLQKFLNGNERVYAGKAKILQDAITRIQTVVLGYPSLGAAA